ncbi:MAG TPA: hypothetical protein VI111_11020, partial [Thermoleophilaceae bacterium]
MEIAEAAKRKRKVKHKRKAKLRCTTPHKKRKPKALKKGAHKAKPKARRSGYSIEAVEAQGAATRRHHKKKHGLKKRRLCTPKKKKHKKKQPTPAPPATPSTPHVTQSPIAVYGGPFGRAQAERLLWRAGFGPSPGWPEAFAAWGLEATVNTLVYPLGAETFTGDAPVDNDGNPLQPEDLWGHDHCFWLDRMVRTNQPLVERM